MLTVFRNHCGLKISPHSLAVRRHLESLSKMLFLCVNYLSLGDRGNGAHSLAVKLGDFVFGLRELHSHANMHHC